MPGDLFIGGAWRAGSTGSRIDVVDPSTGAAFASVADAGVDDALDAVAAAHAAGPAWAATAPRRRSEILRRCFELMLERRQMLAELISLENGKALPDAIGEVTYAAEFFRWFSEEAVRLNGELTVAPPAPTASSSSTSPSASPCWSRRGTSPPRWPTRKIAPALAAGCTVVLKPATETPSPPTCSPSCSPRPGVPAASST